LKQLSLYRSILWIKNSVITLLFFISIQVNAQVVQDTIKGYNTGNLQISDPNSIISAYTYDPITDRYIYTKSFEGFNINYPIVLTRAEYQELISRESIRKYFKDKSDAIDGKKEDSKDKKRDLLPRFYINSGFFETLFGSNTIDIKPTGTVEIDLGVRYSKQDNPSFSPRNRSATTFDFDQRISLSLLGKIGTRLKVNANYDTQSTFAFQNLIKLEYAPTEDDILQKIEVGNVSMPLNSSLIRGSQSLFGVKTQFQFGKTTVTGVFSEQKSQTKTVTAQGGGTVQDFNLFALDYDADRHFFLSQYFRNKYDESLTEYPFIKSRVQITRIEVWVTNRQNRVSTSQDGNNIRNIIALQDLGEAKLKNSNPEDIVSIAPIPANFFTPQDEEYPNNSNNAFDPTPTKIGVGNSVLNSNIREIATSSQGFNGITPKEGIDYSKLENARKLTTNDYTFHPQLGYVSLNQRLTNDEVLAVAYEYTIGDKKYQVGEFGTDGVEATQVGTNSVVPTSQALILKMLKGNLTDVKKPIWNLMMKNIYQIPGAYQLEQNGFKMNIVYSDPSPLNYIVKAGAKELPAGVKETPLLRVFNVDRLNFNNDPQNGGDGFFDFIPELTVDTQNGRIIFTTVEPFGKHLFEKLRSSPTENYNGIVNVDYNDDQRKYVFTSLYKTTQAAALQDSDKNKFELKGKFKSTGGQGISLGASNVPKGSVVVTAGGRVLQEGIDYSVNYQSGRVQILDPSLQASGVPIQVSVENNSVFGQQTRRFMGVNVEHKFSDKFQLGATWLKLTERPFTQKTNYGQESVNNSIFGINGNFSTEVPLLTRLANKLPNVDTDVPSNLSLRGEVAFLKPGTSKNDQFQGQATVYVDDFEGSQSSIDMKSPFAWSLSSVPIDFGGEFGEDKLEYGYKRAKLSWYNIDPIFYTNQRPTSVSDDDVSRYDTRRIYIQELFPNTNIAVGETTVVPTLDLTYYPQERGPYNFNPAAVNNVLPNPKDNFGGITRSISSTNFEQSNVEYIQFWMLDPYADVGSIGPNIGGIDNANQGKIVFNLGEISEDVLKDGRKLYENGLPAGTSNSNIIESNWGKVPAAQSLIYAFDADPTNRTQQDAGLNGLSDAEENTKFPAFAGADPAQDNYQYFLNTEGSITDRYKKYNGQEGNSPVDVTDTNRGAVTLPDVEDINRDNTMNTINAYYKYEIDIKPKMKVGDSPYITDVLESTQGTPNGGNIGSRWIQFKIPIRNGVPEGSISDFRSIRFMRMLVTGFTDKVTLRLGALDLVRGEWRRYDASLQGTTPPTQPDNTGFDIQAVNIENNANRSPIPYVTPPGVTREQLFNNNTVINQNEQSLSLRIYDKNDPNGNEGLKPGDSRAVFKNVDIDMRQYKRLKMVLHAEPLQTGKALENDQMYAFIRFGNDFTQNFYQIEIPLKVSSFGARSPEDVWPADNEMDLVTDLLTTLKIKNINGEIKPDPVTGIAFLEEIQGSRLKIGIKGNPNFGFVRTLMLGVKNNLKTDESIRGEVWFNELRLAEVDNEGGYAAIASMDTNIADLMTLNATGRMNTIGFGALEQSPNERSRENGQQYDIVTNFSLGKLLPKKWGVNLPFNYAVGEQIITPEYDPFNQDIRLQQLLDVTENQDKKDNYRNRAIDYTKRKSINFIGVRKDRGEEQKPHFYDPENLTLSYSFNQTDHHDYEIEELVDQQLRTSVDYAFSFQQKPIEPLKNKKFFNKSAYWKLLSDFNFSYLPTAINFSSSILRQFNQQKFRDVDIQGIGLKPLFRRNYMFDYNYGVNYSLTKSLRLNFTGTRGNLVRNYLDAENNPIDDFSIWKDYLNVGTPNQHQQQLTLNYELPLNKIPFLAFVKSDYTYSGNYSWQRASTALQTVTGEDGFKYNLGNTIQNANTHKLNTTFNMETLYRYIGLSKGSKTPKTPVPAKTVTGPPKPGEKIVAKPKVKQDKPNVFLDGLIGVITSIKNIQVSYDETNGTVLPGYLPTLGFWGTSKPTLGFVFGLQDDVRFEAAKNGWLTNYKEFNQNFTQINTKRLTGNATIDLFPDFKIDLNADRTYSYNTSEQYDVTDGVYNPRSPYNFGNYSISTIMIGSAFSKSDEISSAAFSAFRQNRAIVADRVATLAYGTSNYPINEDVNSPDYKFPLGFGKNSQAVLVPALLAAYTSDFKNGSNVSLSSFRNFPIPNWNIKYTGLMRYKFFKDKFKRFSLQHAYRAAYTMNAFRSNFEYDVNPTSIDAAGNFQTKNIISNVNLSEQFSPLIRMDLELKSSVKVLAELKKDRTIALSFDNNLLTEQKGMEYVIGLGYRIKDVTIRSRFADNASNIIKSDINVRFDLAFRDNKTIVRYLDYDNNQLAGGQNLISGKLNADYAFTKNLTTIFFFDYAFNKAVISTSFPITTIRSGFTLRYNFGN
jgi:cell surface protein SprA